MWVIVAFPRPPRMINRPRRTTPRVSSFPHSALPTCHLLLSADYKHAHVSPNKHHDSRRAGRSWLSTEERVGIDGTRAAGTAQ